MKSTLMLLLGGSGQRFGTELPKQFLKLSSDMKKRVEEISEVSLPDNIVLFAVTAFILAKILDITEIILVVEKDYIDSEVLANQINILKDELPDRNIEITIGGVTRHDSFCCGLQIVNIETENILVQDSNRPYLEKDFLARIKDSMSRLNKENPCYIPVLSQVDSLVVTVEGRIESYLPRERIQRIQTPQLLHVESARKAVQGKTTKEYSDEGSLMLAAGFKVASFEGSSLNSKITYKEDWQL